MKRAISVCASSSGLRSVWLPRRLIVYPTVAGLYQLFERLHPSPDAPSRIELHPQMIAPRPRLQTDSAADLEDFRPRKKRS